MRESSPRQQTEMPIFASGDGPAEDDPAALASMIAELCEALSSAGVTDEQARIAAGATAAPLALDARLAQIQISLERIEARLVGIETELALLLRPSWPF